MSIIFQKYVKFRFELNVGHIPPSPDLKCIQIGLEDSNIPFVSHIVYWEQASSPPQTCVFVYLCTCLFVFVYLYIYVFVCLSLWICICGVLSYCILGTGLLSTNLLKKLFQHFSEIFSRLRVANNCQRENFSTFPAFFPNCQKTLVKTGTLSSGLTAGHQGRALVVSVAAAVICVGRS